MVTMLQMAWIQRGMAAALMVILITSGLVSMTSSANTVFDRVKHRWTFDVASELFLVADSVTRAQASASGSVVELESVGAQSRNSYMSLNGTGASLHLGKFSDCSSDPNLCTSGLTIAFWLRFRDTPGASQYFIGNRDPDEARPGFFVSRDTQGTMRVKFRTASFSCNMVYFAPQGEWVHHVITWNGDKDVAVFLNGMALVRANQSTSRATRATDHTATRRDALGLNTLTLGRAGQRINADLDDVAFWDEVLPREDANQVFSSIFASLVIYRDCHSNASSVCINWKMPEDHFDAVTGLAVMITKASDKTGKIHLLATKTETSTCILNLEAMTTYSLRVQVFLRNRNVFYSKSMTCSTTDGIPNPPSYLAARSVSPTSTSVMWKSPHVTNGVILHFIFCVEDLYTGKVVVNTTQNYAGADSQYSFQIPGRQGRTYRMSVRSVGKLGASSTKSIDVTLLVAAPTRKVNGVRITDLTWSSMSVAWERLRYEIPSSIHYEVRVLEQTSKRVIVVVANGTNTTVKGLMGNTAYYVTLVAASSLGAGPELDKPLLAITPDQNECVDPWDNLCDANADCLDVPGSYVCRCRSGFYGNGLRCRAIPAHAGKGYFCPASETRGVSWPRTYNGETAIVDCPAGAVGYATRRCGVSSPNRIATFEDADLSHCVSSAIAKVQRMLIDPRVSSGELVAALLNSTSSGDQLFGGDIEKSLEYVQVVLTGATNANSPPFNATGTKNTSLSQGFVGIASNLLNDASFEAWRDIPQTNRSVTAEKLLVAMDDVASYVGRGLRDSETYSTKQNSIEFTVSRSTAAMEVEFAAARRRRNSGDNAVNSVVLPVDELQSKTGNGHVAASFILYRNLDRLLLGRSGAAKRAEGDVATMINSAIFSVSVVGKKSVTFTKEPVVLTLKHSKNEYTVNTSCVFWKEADSGASGQWSSEGCTVNSTTADTTVCYCYHLTSFAVLMSVTDVPVTPEMARHGFYLRIISFICLFISLAALMLALFSFLVFRFLQSPRVVYHKNLVIALILANGLFVVGIERTENKIACRVIAVFLHYFFLVAFVWMAMEGLMLYFMLKKIFADRKFLKTNFCQSLCWILPAFYVGILAMIKSDGYGTPDFCWLSTVDGFIWAFVGPIVAVLAMNIFVMAQAFCVMANRRQPKEQDAAAEAWYWLKGCNVLTCLLGVTWILGLFYVNSSTVVFAYLFNIFNALQGLFIFVFHCLIDARVRAEYLRILKCQPRHEYNEKAGYNSSMRFRKFSTKSAGTMDRSSGSYAGKKDRRMTSSERDSNANESGMCYANDSPAVPLVCDENISLEMAASSCSEAHSDSHPLLPMPTASSSLPAKQNSDDETTDDLLTEKGNEASKERPNSGSYHVPLRPRFSVESLCKETQLSDRTSIHFDRLKEGSMESLVQQVVITDEAEGNMDVLDRLELLDGRPWKPPLKPSRSRPYDDHTIVPLSIIKEPSSESLNTIKSNGSSSKPSSPTTPNPNAEKTTLKIELRRSSTTKGNGHVIVADFQSLKDEESDTSLGGIDSQETVSDRPPSQWMEEASDYSKFLNETETNE